MLWHRQLDLPVLKVKIVDTQQMRALEAGAEAKGIPVSLLMENAGKASALEIERVYRPLSDKKILVLAGPGNNGGDGLVAARYLSDFRVPVTIVLGAPRKKPDTNMDLVLDKRIPFINAQENFQEFEKTLTVSTIVIDSLFGTGKARPLEGIYKHILEKVRLQKSRSPSMQVVAIDLPSGLDADTGMVDAAACPADLTITMAYPKKGFFAFPGANYLGRLITVDIGIPPVLADSISTELITPEWVKSHLPGRPREAHKGTFGKVMVIAGSTSYFGAPYLTCAGAYRAGAGMVTLASLKKVTELTAAKSAETTYLPLPENDKGCIDERSLDIILGNLESYNALLIGPGIGRENDTAAFLNKLLVNVKSRKIKLVLDADALNLLAARIPDWHQNVSAEAILTPHPAEFSRLTGLSISDVQQDRIEKAKKFARQWNKIIVLKGPFTVMAGPDGHAMISPWANPALATAGTGDVLAGTISAFLAQGMLPFFSAAAGVYIHGLAGEIVRESLGESGAIASDLLPRLPLAIKKLRHAA